MNVLFDIVFSIVTGAYIVILPCYSQSIENKGGNCPVTLLADERGNVVPDVPFFRKNILNHLAVSHFSFNCYHS